ncbi:MAG: hypothetical protein IJ716_04380 [Lachnospiraceae bacterium]|nr:hypothetical protein [Lachnospiraceae bacterium]
MKRKICATLTGLLAAVLLASCGADPALSRFKTDMDKFCNNVAEINDAINAIDVGDENAPTLALEYLDRLDKEFQNFAEMDFPEDYDYLEPLADEAGSYMAEAVKSYHQAYADGGYDKSTADYARENSARAFKRVQVILDILHGEMPDNAEESAQN